jgi:CPA2 family monovalent cation:H+ antiporter-2
MIHDLGIIMLTAGIISLLFKFLGQPVVLGYIIAGIFVGPYVCGASWVSNPESVDTWGQVGVIFLLFALGLEFSFKKLLQVGSTAIISTLVIVVGMMTTGFLVGRLMGWSDINALFLGGMLSMSSTTIVFKALDDLGLRQQQFARLCFGILIVEDLFAVVLMVLLASIAVSNTFEGGEMLLQVAKLGAYLLFWFVCGIALIPSLLKRCKRYLNDETMTILSLGLCLGMVLLAKGAGFSEALGAFVMGSILAETVEAERIERLVKPIKDLFGAIFFVSVGMMIDPSLLVRYGWPIALLTVVVIVGQIIFASLGCILSGQPLKVAMQSAFSLTQIGEFAFIIANFGESLHVTESYLYPVVVAVSVITTFLTPYMIRLAEPAYGVVCRILPQSFQQRLERYAQGRNIITVQSVWRRLLHKVLTTLVIYLVLSLFVVVLYFQYVSTPVVDLLSMWLPEWLGRLSSLGLLLLCVSPFLYKMATGQLRCPEAMQLWNMGNYNRGSLVGLILLRVLLVTGVVIFAISRLFTLTYGVLVGVSVIIVWGLLYSKRIRHQSSQMEQRFLRNLSAREVAQNRQRPVRREFEQRLLSYDLHIADFELSADSTLCGKMLMELNLRKNIGVNIVRIVRGGYNVNVPGGKERLYPYDHLVACGNDRQIADFQAMLEQADRQGKARSDDAAETRRIPVSLEHLCVTESMHLCGKTIAESHIREEAACSVIGIERGDEMLMNPDPNIRFEVGDVVILAGETHTIEHYEF